MPVRLITLFVPSLPFQTGLPVHRHVHCWYYLSRGNLPRVCRHRVQATTHIASNVLVSRHGHENTEIRGEADVPDVLTVIDKRVDSRVRLRKSRRPRVQQIQGPHGFSADAMVNGKDGAIDAVDTDDNDNDGRGDNGGVDTTVSRRQRSKSLDSRMYDAVADMEIEETYAPDPIKGGNRSFLYPRRRRSTPDPHAASHTTQATFLAHVAKQPKDPTSTVWRRQNSLLVEEARQKGLDSAVNLLWQLNEEGRAASQNFNQVISLLASKGRFKDGLELALEAHRQGFACIITFRPLMKLCCASGDGKAAMCVWKAMVECGIEGDMFLFAELMGALVRSHDISSAERVIKSLRDGGKRPHIVLYNTLLKGLARQANVDHAFTVFDSIVEDVVKPDETTFNTILNTCVRAKDLDALNRAMELMRLHRVKPGVPTFNTLLKLYARTGEFQDALDIFHEMQQLLEPSIVTYNTLIDGCAHRGDMDQAADFFDEMMKKGMTPDICTMTSLLKGFGRSNNPGGAVELYEAMKEGGYCIEERTRYAVIDACLRGNDRANAKRLIQEMLNANLRIRTRTWLQLLETDILCDDEDGALDTLHEMGRNGIYLDAPTKSELLREVRERRHFLRFQRELNASKTSSITTDRRKDD